MKQLYFIFSLFISLSTYCQSSFIGFEDYSGYMIPKNLNDRIIYLDSIYKTTYVYNHGTTNKFIVTNRDQFNNVTEANTININSYSFSRDKKSINIQYYDQNHIKSFLGESIFNMEIDTADYYEFDYEGKKLTEQHRYNLFCYTGSPNDENKIEYFYNQNGNIIHKIEKLKWNLESDFRPFNIWVINNSYDYFYDSNYLTKEIQYSNYFDERDTFVNLQIYPFAQNTFFYNNEKIDSIVYKAWNLEDSLWENQRLEKYSYKGDTTIVTSYLWKTNQSIWEKQYQTIKYMYLSKENYVQNKWNSTKNNFDFYKSLKFEYSGDTLVQNEQYTSYNLYTYFLYNSKGLLEYNSQKYYKNGKWKTYYEKSFEYDSYFNPQKILYLIYSTNDTTKIKTEYFWHTKYKQQDKYIPMLQKGNQWNVLTIDDEFRPGHTDTTWFTSKLHIDDLSFLSEDTIERKVYITKDGKESILYDFGMKPGDTLTYYYPDTTLGIRFIIRLDSIHNVTFESGKPTRKFFISSKFVKESQFHDFDYWIEGMGSPEGPVPYKNVGWSGDYKTESLLCFKHYDELLYMDHNYDSCDENYSSVYEYPVEKVTISPNPASDYIKLTSGTNYEWQQLMIFDIYGNKILSKNISGSQDQIDISLLPAGVYILMLKDNTNRHTILKKFTKI